MSGLRSETIIIKEKCGCGAEIEIQDSYSLPGMYKALRAWRADHKHEPFKTVREAMDEAKVEEELEVYVAEQEDPIYTLDLIAGGAKYSCTNCGFATADAEQADDHVCVPKHGGEITT